MKGDRSSRCETAPSSIVMKQAIESIWISLETKGFITDEETLDQNTDVVVTFSDGKRYVATFFTYQNSITLTKKNRLTGEYLSGKYFWASDMVLINRIDRTSIEQVINEFIRDGCFPFLFKLIEPSSSLK